MRHRIPVSLAALWMSMSAAHAQVADDRDRRDPSADSVDRLEVPVTVDPGPRMAPPGTSPVVPGSMAACTCCCCARPAQPPRGWSIGLALGGLALAPERSPDDETQFAIGELVLALRATEHIELAVSLGGGRERVDGEDGDLEVSTAVLSARWQFLPASVWNLYAMVGIGAASITRDDASDRERRDAVQPLGAVGVGLERRFGPLAVGAELRGVGLGRRRETVTSSRAALDPETAAMASSTTAKSGGALLVGLRYSL